MIVTLSPEYVLDPDWWVGCSREYPMRGKWHLLYTDGDALCRTKAELDDDGPLSSVPDGALCGTYERVARARRIGIDPEWT